MHHGLQLFCEPTWSTFSGLTSEYSRRRPAMWSAADTPANASALMSTLVEEGALGACAAAGAGAAAAVAVAARGAAVVEEDDDAPVNRMKGFPAGSGTTTGAALGKGAYCQPNTTHTPHNTGQNTGLQRRGLRRRRDMREQTHTRSWHEELHSSSTHGVDGCYTSDGRGADLCQVDGWVLGGQGRPDSGTKLGKRSLHLQKPTPQMISDNKPWQSTMS